MRHWKPLLLALTLSLPILPALANSDCSTPNEATAATVVKAIQSVCILAKQAIPDGRVDPVLEEEVNESIRSIGGKLDAPNPFGRCWWDSRFDCLKAKEAVGILADQVAAFEDAHYLDQSIAAATRTKRAEIVNAREVLTNDINSYCNTLRH